MAAWNCFCNFAFVFSSFFRVGVRRRGIWKDIIPTLKISKNKLWVMDRKMLTSVVCCHLTSIILGVGSCSLDNEGYAEPKSR